MTGLLCTPPVAAGDALRATLDRVAARNEYVKVRHGRPPEPGWLEASALTDDGSPHLGRLLAAVGAAYETPKRDVMASFFVGGYGWQLAAVAVGAYLVDRRVPSLAPAAVLVRVDDKGNAEEIALLSDRFTSLPDDPAAGDPDVATVPDGAALRAVLRRELESHLAPLIDAVRARAPLGKRAMWLSVADDIAWNVIHHAKDSASPDRARAEAAALTSDPEAPWRGRTGVLEVEGQGRRECFVARASCCLSYKLPAGEKCASCPLQPAEERLRRLRDRLVEQQ